MDDSTEDAPSLADDFGSGLRLFPPGTPATIRRRRLLFLIAWGAIGALLVWPIYSFFAGARPLILGLPLSLAWVLLAMVLMFGALLALFFGDERDRGRSAEVASSEGPSDG